MDVIALNNLARHPKKAYGSRALSQIRRIIIHHFAGNITISEAARMHVQQKGWPGIGYYRVIDLDGKTYQTNALSTISYHCSLKNTASVGLALRGNWSKELPPQIMLDALMENIEDIRRQVGRDIPVGMHRMYKPTKCPGDALATYLQNHNLISDIV